ncbi:MAG: T9SS type A sorting domain-containing protein, partial [Saprospiraceae bacterium]
STGDVSGVGSNGTFTLVDANGCQAPNQSFTFDVLDCALPVELISFTGNKKGADVILNWNTTSEINNDYFVVEHSLNGDSFEKIGQVNGSGNTTYEVNYDFTHKNPRVGYNYYRLRQVDYDGSFEYSNVVRVRFDSKENSIYVRPTVASNEVTLVLTQKFETQATLQVMDVAGRILMTENMEMNVLEMTLSIEDLASGHYFVKVKGDNETYTTRFVKKIGQ